MVRMIRMRFPALWAILAGLALGTCPGRAADLRRDATVQAVEKVMPSVVNIGTETVMERSGGVLEELLREFYGPYYRQRPAESRFTLGSGVIIDEDGHVLTNDHVVRRASKIWVKLMDGREYAAESLGSIRGKDLALLRLLGKEGEKFSAVELAPPGDLLLGETVIALGNPFGLGGSVSRGILSSKNRRPLMEGEALDIADWLQTDAAINPGNSGGPLVNLLGQLIGINVAVYREGQGIGFAIPISQVAEALGDIFTPETLKGLWFGARVVPAEQGLEIHAIEPESPVAQAGLQVGDRIESIDGLPCTDQLAFTRYLTRADFTSERKLRFSRNGETDEVSLRLVPESSFFNAGLIRRRLGMDIQPLTRELAETFGFNLKGGYVIAGIEPGGPAEEAGLVPNMVIQAWDGLQTRDMVDTARLVHDIPSGGRIRLDLMAIWTNGQSYRQRSGVAVLVTR